MAIGIEITLDPGNVVNGANQVDSALDGIGNSADNVQKKTNSMGDAFLAALSRQQKATQQMLANAQATKAVAQEQSRLLASQSSLNSSSAQSEARQKEYQRLSGEIRKATQQEAAAKKELAAINNQIANQKLPEPQNLNKTENALQNIVTAGKAFLALAVVQKATEWGSAFVQVADNINLLQSRIALYTRSQQEANAVFDQLVSVSNRAGVSVQDTASSFARFASAGKDIGVSNDQVIKLITNLQTMARVSGASSQEASAAIYQLSQSFASGRLQGDEFRSVSEQLPVVLDALSKKLGVTRAELRQMATDGKLNQDVLLMLAGNFEDLDAQAAKLPRTVAQASEALMNNLGVAADALNDKLGISQGLAKSIDGISQALEYWTRKLDGQSTQVDELNRTLVTQNGTLIRQQQAYNDLSDKTSMYGRYLLEQIDKQKAAIKETENQITSMQRLAGVAQQLAADLAKATGPQKEPAKDPAAQKLIDNLQEQITYTQNLAKGNYELAASAKLGASATKDQITAYAGLLKQQTEYKAEVKAGKKEASEAAAAAKREAAELLRNQNANQKYVKTLRDKTAAGEYDVQRAQEMVAQSLRQGQSVDQLSASYLKSIQVQNQLTLASQQSEAQSRLNKDATDAEKQAVDQYVASLYQQQQAKQLSAQVSQIQTDTTNELNPVQGQMDQIAQQEAERLAVLEQARQQDLLNEEQYQQLKTQIQQSGEQQRNDLLTQNNAMLLGATSDLFGGLADTLKQSQGEQSGIYKAMFAASKAFAIAQASVLLWQNVSKAMAVGFPQNIPFIAAAFAQGTSILGSLSSIAATGFATGGYITGAGTGTSDSIPARLSAGEYVMPAQQTRQYRNELAAMRAGTYDGQGGSGGMKVEVSNYGNDNVTAQQLDENRIRLIIGEEVPRVNAAEFNNPYSQTNKAYRSNYNAERKV
ncbi:MAG: tape measure [Siphoviridae sp. ctdc_1]|nr:MAG: tape measure [Siphoviridae sp. ctdc_1]